MKNLIILGNGFDIDLGLNTSFKAFVESIDFLSIPDLPLIKRIKEKEMDNWYDLERQLRNELVAYSHKPSQDLSNDINIAWRLIKKHWGEYFPRLIDLDNIKINKESCAYHLLNVDAKHTTLWYTFNYTNPWYLCQLQNQAEIRFVHNEATPLDFAKHHGFMYLVPNDLIIGVDSMVPKCIKMEAKLSPIIKIRNNSFQNKHMVDLHQHLLSANNVIIFGQSFGITDSDYFKPYFKSIICGEIQQQNLYIVTYNSSSLSRIITNMYEYGIEYGKILHSNVNVKIVYTEQTASSHVFNQMISNFYTDKVK